MFASVILAACLSATGAQGTGANSPSQIQIDTTRPDTVAISRVARELSSDAMRGRGPFTRENENVARRLAAELERLGARPLFGNRLLVPFFAPTNPTDTVFNVVGVLPNRSGSVSGDLVGITAHLDHLGVGRPDARGDSIHNGFLDAAVPVAMVLDVARRYSRAPGQRPLLVMFFNLEEQGLLGAKALLARSDASALTTRLKLLIGVDAGSPAGEAVEWQLMGTLPSHAGAVLADSLARARGWTTTSTAPRAISDVFPFSQAGVPIIFPIPGRVWKGYTEAQRNAAMSTFDHYHQPSDEWRADFPWVGTWHFADWLWEIVQLSSR
jgi:Zn-dependent M28 family amino/carboxypeptidase